MSSKMDKRYLDILLEALRVCKQYKPKLGYGGKDGYTLEQFHQLYHSDPFYHWMGLDNPLMYAAHKAAGGMTSIYRQIGIGCERLFRAILQDSLRLSEEESTWSYTVPKPGGKIRTLYLDGRIPFEAVKDVSRQQIIRDWMKQAAQTLEIDGSIRESLMGIVFEIRQGYKSKDSKRQNADIANAATAYTKGYLPCAAILSQQIDQDIAFRYKAEKWMLLTGITGDASPHESFYAFMKEIVGYDLVRFFERNKVVLKEEVKSILENLLAAK
jgi:hypothetical protein